MRAGTVTASEVKYVTLRDIVLEANADIARMQQQAFVDTDSPEWMNPSAPVHARA